MWNSDLRWGFVSHTSKICAGFARLTRKGVVRGDAATTIDGRTWWLDQLFFQSGDKDCAELGNADSPVITPDERHLFFLASPAAKGQSGLARLGEPWHLYTQDLVHGRPTGQPRVVARGFVEIGTMVMAPDGRSVLISGRRGGEHGLWRVDLANGHVTLVAEGRLSVPSFSPEGRHLVFTRRVDSESGKDEMRVIDLG